MNELVLERVDDSLKKLDEMYVGAGDRTRPVALTRMRKSLGVLTQQVPERFFVGHVGQVTNLPARRQGGSEPIGEDGKELVMALTLDVIAVRALPERARIRHSALLEDEGSDLAFGAASGHGVLLSGRGSLGARTDISRLTRVPETSAELAAGGVA